MQLCEYWYSDPKLSHDIEDKFMSFAEAKIYLNVQFDALLGTLLK